MPTPPLGSILLASTDPDRLRAWYERAFGVTPNADGFLPFGPVNVLVDRRDDVADRTAEPGRIILNLHVEDIRATVAHLEAVGAEWVAELDDRGDALFAAVADPDGNTVQVIELTPSYWATRGRPTPLSRAKVSGRLPVQDLDRARRFYAEQLGLEPAEARPGGLRYVFAAGSFSLFESTGQPSGDHTQLAFEVDDLDAVVADLRARGVTFEEFGIVDVEGNYPSAEARGERGTWFRDSEGNLLGLGQPLR